MASSRPLFTSSKLVLHICKMLDPVQGGTFFEPLHRVFCERMPEMNTVLSRCRHEYLFPDEQDNTEMRDPVRSNQYLFQIHFKLQNDGWDRPPKPYQITGETQSADNICCTLLNRVVFYGEIGSGSKYHLLFYAPFYLLFS